MAPSKQLAWEFSPKELTEPEALFHLGSRRGPLLVLREGIQQRPRRASGELLVPRLLPCLDHLGNRDASSTCARTAAPIAHRGIPCPTWEAGGPRSRSDEGRHGDDRDNMLQSPAMHPPLSPHGLPSFLKRTASFSLTGVTSPTGIGSTGAVSESVQAFTSTD